MCYDVQEDFIEPMERFLASLNKNGSDMEEVTLVEVTISLPTNVKQVRKQLLQAALAHTHGNMTKATKLLGISNKSGYNWLKEK